MAATKTIQIASLGERPRATTAAPCAQVEYVTRSENQYITKVKPLHVRLIGVNTSFGGGLLELTSQRELGPDLLQVSDDCWSIVSANFSNLPELLHTYSGAREDFCLGSFQLKVCTEFLARSNIFATVTTRQHKYNFKMTETVLNQSIWNWAILLPYMIDKNSNLDGSLPSPTSR